MCKIPVKFEDYARSIVQNGYMLSDGDKFFLKGFKEYYVDRYEMVNVKQHMCTYRNQPLEHVSINLHILYYRKDELEHICTLVKVDDLKKILDGGDMDGHEHHVLLL